LRRSFYGFRYIHRAIILPRQRAQDFVCSVSQGENEKRQKENEMTDRIFGTRVIVPEFEIFSNPTVKISDVAKRRFNVLDRYEQSVEFIAEILEKNSDHAYRRNFIAKYIREQKRYENLRVAIREVCPEYEEMLDKLLVLK